VKKLHKQAKQLTKDAQAIERMIFEYNDGIEATEKVPLDNIQASIACLCKDYAGLYSDTAQEIRRQFEDEKLH